MKIPDVTPDFVISGLILCVIIIISMKRLDCNIVFFSGCRGTQRGSHSVLKFRFSTPDFCDTPLIFFVSVFFRCTYLKIWQGQIVFVTFSYHFFYPCFYSAEYLISSRNNPGGSTPEQGEQAPKIWCNLKI